LLPPEDLARARINVTTLGDLLLTAADRHPDSLALVFPDRALTYRQLVDGAMRRARALQELGVKPRDHVGLLMHTCAEFVESFFAIAFCGGVIVPINARYKSNELAYVIENGDIVTVVTTDAVADSVNFVERLNGAFKDLPRSRDTRNLKVAGAPKLRNIVLLGRTRAKGYLTEADFDAAAKAGSELDIHCARRVRVRDVASMLTRRDHRQPQGLPDHARSDGAQQHRARAHRYRLTTTHVPLLPMFHIAVLPMLAIRRRRDVPTMATHAGASTC
jgi:fatty-acyl-CoA synthase/long-chain acyl-CoA synthetase